MGATKLKHKIVLAILLAASVFCAAQQNTEPVKAQEARQVTTLRPVSKSTPVITYIRAGKLLD